MITGEFVKQWREKRKMSQQGFADCVQMKLRTLQDWESTASKSQPPDYFDLVLEALALRLAGGLDAVIEERMQPLRADMREQIEFEYAVEQAKQEKDQPKPAAIAATTRNAVGIVETPTVSTAPAFNPYEKPVGKSFAQRQREDLERRAAAKGVCPDCGDPSQWCSCEAHAL